MKSTATSGFFKLCLTTLVAVYFLIAVGGIVRSTGSGMGCPDWPKCFGSWVPPTSVDQLPSDYKETYSQLRDKKNQKFARYLTLIGLDETAQKIRDDKSILNEADFNALKTWIEYVNRLIGVLIGLLIVALFGYSLRFRKTRPVLFWYSLLTLVGVIVQGWLGSIVVSTNLTAWTITVHMFLAVAIVGWLTYLLYKSGNTASPFASSPAIKLLLLSALALTLIQIFFGTQVREGIDLLASQLMARAQWIDNLGTDFIIHRSFSWVVVIINGLIVYKLIKTTSLKPLIQGLILLILCSLLTGIGMAYGGVPPVLQPVHLLVATVTFGIQLLLFFKVNTKQPAVLND